MDTVTVKERRMTLSSAPALLFFTSTPEKAALKGTVLLYHGLTSRKEDNRKELSSLARRGFLAVGIDNVGHGERKYPDFDGRFSGSSRENFEKVFLEMVRETTIEIPRVIESLIHRDYADPAKIGVTGISMGGYITYGSVLQDRRIKAIVPILGSPRWKSSMPESPHLHADKFFPAAIFAQNAGKDESVPPEFAREFHKTLEPMYRQAPEMNQYVEYPESGHFMREEDWEKLWEGTIGWFERFL